MITLKNLTKKFDRKTVVDDVNLKVSAGEIVGFLGPNGAGKTTTLRMIAGILPPSEGEVLINNQNLEKAGSLKNLIGYLPESNPLYLDMTVEEFLDFWAAIKGIDKTKKQQAINFVVESTGIEDVYYRPIRELSKGYKQRVGLSQAILTKPDILILDEPTEGLDPNQRRDIQALIQNLGKKKTVIISSHVLSEISKICSRVVIINKGKLAADGKPENLQKLHHGNQTIEAEIQGKGVAAALKALPGVLAVAEKDTDYYSIETSDGKDLRPDIFSLAKTKSWTLLTLLKKNIDLEDVFQEITNA